MACLATPAVSPVRGGPSTHERPPSGPVNCDDWAVGIVRSAEMVGEPIDVEALIDSVTHPGAGAVVLFRGDVRDVDEGRQVVRLEYEGHPTAGAVLAQVAAEIAAGAGPDVAVSVAHRLGRLQIGDAALVVAVSAEHRAAAFLVCEQLVEQVKLRIPVWKLQVFADGSNEWVNCA